MSMAEEFSNKKGVSEEGTLSVTMLLLRTGFPLLTGALSFKTTGRYRLCILLLFFISNQHSQHMYHSLRMSAIMLLKVV